ncbi:DUF4411 family protein [Deferribacterales bacterium RsTz2092]|nr:twitching motility protein PilT [Deferribacterales bacterium]
MINETFIIDTNSLITPYRNYYAFDIVPTFWSSMEQAIVSGRVIILDKVFDELVKNDDGLSKWIKSKHITPLKSNDINIIGNYTDVINYISEAKCYNVDALRRWSEVTVADPWLIASARTHGYSVVTLETSANLTQLTSKVKIPDVCRHFNIKCYNLYNMMRELSFKL